MLDTNAQISVIQIWMAAVRQITSLQNVILTARMDVKRERTRCRQQEEFFESIMDSFIDLLHSATTHASYAECKKDLDDLSHKMKASREELKVQRQRSNELENGLSNQEYQLTKLEEEIYQKLDTEFRLGSPKPTSPPAQPAFPTQRQFETVDTDTSRGPREELYSRMADLRILLERLNNFEFDLRDELDQRDILRATGQFDVSSDAAFFEETRAERAKIQTELEQAQADVERLKQQCIQRGIQFEDVQFHNLFNDADIDTFSTPSTQEEAAILPLPESPGGIIGSFLIARERVKRWLDPSSPQNQGNSPAEHEGDSQARRESWSDVGWVTPDSWPRRERPSAGDGAHGMPVWNSGPPPGSSHLEALLRECSTEVSPLPIKQMRRRESHTTL